MDDLTQDEVTSDAKLGGENPTFAWSKFGIDRHTGFLSSVPLPRLPPRWEAWEAALDDAMQEKLQLGTLRGLSEDEQKRSEEWRSRVRHVCSFHLIHETSFNICPIIQLPILPITELLKSEILLERAHHVLSFTLHFYVHTLPPEAPVKIPPPLTLPLLQVSAELDIPPTRVYADDILNNWIPPEHGPSPTPTVENLRSRSLFTGTTDEDEFYMTTARIELRGAELLNLMHTILFDAASVETDPSAIQRITHALTQFSVVIPELRTILLDQRHKIDPDYFYKCIRLWIAGERSETPEGRWIFEGIELDPTLQPPTELHGPSAAQSSLIQSLDVFLSVHHYNDNNPDNSYIQRMRLSIPRRHRAFLEYLGDPSVTRPLRELVRTTSDTALMEAYNNAVLALKEFRDAHMIIFTLYVVGPARRLAKTELRDNGDGSEKKGKDTATGDLARLLKGFRDRTAGAVMDSSSTS